MPGSGWAAVQTWVRNAEAKQNDLQIVSADQARPGDIVAYDWGHQDDFGSDGHIGFLASNVQDGKFTALEGNNQDQVMKVPRDVNMANVKFIRIGGDAPPPAGAAVPEAAAPGGVADAAAAGGRRWGRRQPVPGRQRGEGTARGVARPRGGEARVAEAAPGHGVARRVRASRTSTTATPTRSASSRCASGSGTRARTPASPRSPSCRSKWFLDQAEAVKKQRIARGQSVTDPRSSATGSPTSSAPPSSTAAATALRLGEANGLLGHAADAPAAAPVAQAPAAAAVDAAAAAAPSGGGGGAGARALAALAEAEKYKGKPYKWGGSTPQTGFDCSGLAQWAYAKAGIQIPRVTDAQFAASNGTSVDRGDLRPGDLIFFGKPGNIYHVAISMGGDKFIHAPKTGDVIREASLKESYFSSNYAGAKRFDNSAPVEAAASAAPVEPQAVAEAQAAVARDAAEVNRQGSGLFMAVKAMEERRHDTVQFMKAIDPKDAAAAAGQPQAAAAAARPRRPPPTRPPPRPHPPRPTPPSLPRRRSTPASR